jgi:hypothetical protein
MRIGSRIGSTYNFGSSINSSRRFGNGSAGSTGNTGIGSASSTSNTDISSAGSNGIS